MLRALQDMKISAAPGVYLFKNRAGKILYIGKASNLKERLHSYKNIRDLPHAKQKMLREAGALELQQTSSEPEALILEASLIKKHRPKYNVLLRDDKNYFFVEITKEKYPRISLTHQPKLGNIYVGPFTDGNALKRVLRMLRNIFSYCTCKKFHARMCVNTEMGRCPGFCCCKNQDGKLYDKQYRKNIKNIIAVLTGKKISLLKKLQKSMEQLSKQKQYERAAIERDQMLSIKKIFSHSHFIKRNLDQELPKALRILEELVDFKEPMERIEGYDISNIQGKKAVGSMVVFQNGIPKKEHYRRFKIKTVLGANDPAMIYEIIKRRFHNRDWPSPNLILIDGGKPQLNAAIAAVSEIRSTLPVSPSDGKNIAIIALAKREEELYLPNQRVPIKLRMLPPPLLHLLQHIRNEAHRFAVAYHRNLRKKSLLN